MIIIDEILIQDQVLEKKFVCQLDKCKGACCWEGDYGAPLTADEVDHIAEALEQIWPYISEEGRQVIKEKGAHHYYKSYNEQGTPLMDDGRCAYMNKDENGIAQCAIEQANSAGLSAFQKPISCHLYPLRIKSDPHTGFQMINYEHWDICNPACLSGTELDVPVFAFVKDALIRKFGLAFYEKLEGYAQSKNA